jgi:pimeloyl-ACP methyl ester carboxylesterase
MHPTDHSFSHHGLAFHYVAWGAPGAPAIVLLHGLTGHARTWDRLAAELASRYRVLALDQRGHGDTAAAPDGDYAVGTMAEDVAAFAEHVALARFALIGLSMGGRVAIAYAARHRERVERLALVDIGPEIHIAGLERIRSSIAATPERFDSEEEAIELARRANPLYAEDELVRRVRHGLRRTPDGSLAWKYDRALRQMMRDGGRRDTTDLWEPLARIACPALVVRGALSDILSPEIAHKMLDRLADGRLVEIANAGHTVPGDQPAEFSRVVHQFLAE